MIVTQITTVGFAIPEDVEGMREFESKHDMNEWEKRTYSSWGNYKFFTKQLTFFTLDEAENEKGDK